MNTLSLPVNGAVDLETRLERLAAADPVTAGLLKPLVETIRAGRAGDESPLGRQLTSAWVRCNIRDNTVNVVIVPGSGIGFDLPTLMCELPPLCRVFWMETNPRKVAGMFMRCAVEEYVESGRLRMALGCDEKFVEQSFLKMWDMPQGPSFKIYDQTTASPEEDMFYNRVLKSICNALTLSIFNIGTLICRGGLWQMNTLKNLPILLRNPGVVALRNAFKGKPALVVGAGPSLNAALPYLKTCASGYVVVSTGTALRALRNAGIRPDLVVAVDAHPLMASQFKVPCNDLYLVCSTLVFPPAPPKFKGLFAGTLDANPIDAWLDKLTGERGVMLAAGTVTSTAVDLAVFMGCSTVVTIGFDLSLANDGTTHARNTMYHGVKVDMEHGELVRVPGNYQETVLTTRQFRNYLILLEQYVEQHKETCLVNVTDTGAQIRGMKLATPDRLNEFAAMPFDAAAVVESAHRSFADDCREPVAAALVDHMGRLDTVATTARAAARICNELLVLASRSGQDVLTTMQGLAGELEAADRTLQELQASSCLLEMSLWPACYGLTTCRVDHEKSYSEAVFAFKRWRQFYEQITGAAMWTRDLVRQTIADIQPVECLPAAEPASVQERCLIGTA
ncbi:MAG: 6-hydroxymethylpterin diphosphokinase MptE-like protein [bacterium]